MTLFAPDLYRSFAIGFIGAGAVLAATTIDDFTQFSPDFVPEAQAAEAVAPVSDDITISEEFEIVVQPGDAEQ